MRMTSLLGPLGVPWGFQEGCGKPGLCSRGAHVPACPRPGREALLEVCFRGCQVSGGARGLAAAHITEPRWRWGSHSWGEPATVDTEESLGGDVVATVGTDSRSLSEAPQNCGRDCLATSHTWGIPASPASPVVWLPTREGWWDWGSDEGKR